MYNEALKMDFLEQYQGVHHVPNRRFFEASELLEYEYGKDLAEFSLYELEIFFSKLGFLEPEAVRGRIAGLIHYGNFYQQCFPYATPVFKGYDIKSYPYKTLFAPTLILEPEQLFNRIEQVYSLDSAQPAIAALCFAWLGVDCSDAVRLRTEQVDTKVGIIYDAMGNVVLPAMPECIREMLYIYAKTREAIRVQNQTFWVYADNIGYFIKRMKTRNSEKESGAYSPKQLSAQVGLLANQYEELFGKDNAEWATYTNVQRSGNFYRLYQMERAGTDVFNAKNADKVRLCLGKSKRNHKDNMVLYTAYKEIRAEAGLD